MAASASIFRSRLQASLDANKALVFSKYVQLATVRPDGRPANRTVVFRFG
jgi:pyridoxamine 5'-phosphate oxidase